MNGLLSRACGAGSCTITTVVALNHHRGLRGLSAISIDSSDTELRGLLLGLADVLDARCNELLVRIRIY